MARHMQPHLPTDFLPLTCQQPSLSIPTFHLVDLLVDYRFVAFLRKAWLPASSHASCNHCPSLILTSSLSFTSATMQGKASQAKQTEHPHYSEESSRFLRLRMWFQQQSPCLHV